MSEPFPPEQELLGVALIPVATLLGLLLIWLTRRILAVLKQHL